LTPFVIFLIALIFSKRFTFETTAAIGQQWPGLDRITNYLY
jgi:hypothetical protein